MKKSTAKALSAIGIFPGDIVTKRPDNMSYEGYKEQRRENRKQIDSYLRSGKSIHVSAVERRVNSADGLYLGKVMRKNPQPYVNTEKFNQRFERHKRDSRFVQPTEAHLTLNPARMQELKKKDWTAL